MTGNPLTADALVRVLNLAFPEQTKRLGPALTNFEGQQSELPLRQMIRRPCVLTVSETGAIDDHGNAFADRTIILTVDTEGAEELSLDWCDAGDPETALIEYILGDTEDMNASLYTENGEPAGWLPEDWEERAQALARAATAYVDALADDHCFANPEAFTVTPLADGESPERPGASAVEIEAVIEGLRLAAQAVNAATATEVSP